MLGVKINLRVIESNLMGIERVSLVPITFQEAQIGEATGRQAMKYVRPQEGKKQASQDVWKSIM